MKRVRISLSTLAIAGLIGAGLSAAPIGVDDQFAPEFKTADAKGKGSGKSAGKGGKGGKSGKRGGHGAGGSDGDSELVKGFKDKNKFGDEDIVHDAHEDDELGNGHLKAKGNGHLKHHHGDGDHDDDGKYSNSLGNLNAAHASPNARLHASENSMVGLLAAYAAAVEDGTLDTEDKQRAALGAISNKSYLDPELKDLDVEDPDANEPNVDDPDVDDPDAGGVAAVDAEVVREVNALLGVSSPQDDPTDEDDEEAAN